MIIITFCDFFHSFHYVCWFNAKIDSKVLVAPMTLFYDVKGIILKIAQIDWDFLLWWLIQRFL